jgi:hypothetical protein
MAARANKTTWSNKTNWSNWSNRERGGHAKVSLSLVLGFDFGGEEAVADAAVEALAR